MTAEAAALGCEMDWGTLEDMPTARTQPWAEPGDVHIPDDFLSRPSIRTILDAIAILRARYGDHVAIVGKAMGPWTLAYHLHGLQEFLIETITDTDKVCRFLERLKEITVVFAQAQIRAGADVICIADHATGDLVSPQMYRDLLLPHHRDLTQRIGCPTVLHICGQTRTRMKYICESGFDCFHFDSRVDAHAAVAEVAGRISLMGNINNPEILLHGTPQQVAEQTRYARAAGIQVIGPECAVPLITPLANLQAITRAVEETSI